MAKIEQSLGFTFRVGSENSNQYARVFTLLSEQVSVASWQKKHCERRLLSSTFGEQELRDSRCCHISVPVLRAFVAAHEREFLDL